MTYPIELHEDCFPLCHGLGVPFLNLSNLVLSLRLSKPWVTCSLPPFPIPIPHGDWSRDLETQKVKIIVWDESNLLEIDKKMNRNNINHKSIQDRSEWFTCKVLRASITWLLPLPPYSTERNSFSQEETPFPLCLAMMWGSRESPCPS